MNSAVIPTIRHPKQYYLDKEESVFSRIPGMDKLLHADDTNICELEKQYPDAAFALRTANSLFVGDHEQNVIHQKAYSAILKGDSIPDIRFRYDRDMDAYVQRHMWD